MQSAGPVLLHHKTQRRYAFIAPIRWLGRQLEVARGFADGLEGLASPDCGDGPSGFSDQ